MRRPRDASRDSGGIALGCPDASGAAQSPLFGLVVTRLTTWSRVLSYVSTTAYALAGGSLVVLSGRR